MGHIYRLKVNQLGEEENVTVNGRIIYINCPFKKSRKIFSYPKWRFRKSKFVRNLKQYNITCVEWFEYSPQNVLYNYLLNKLSKYDWFCFELVGFSPATVNNIKHFLLELKPSLQDKILLVVINNSIDDEIFSEFPLYESGATHG